MVAKIVFESLGMAHEFTGLTLVVTLPDGLKSTPCGSHRVAAGRSRLSIRQSWQSVRYGSPLAAKVEDVHPFLDLRAGVHETVVFDLVTIILGENQRLHGSILDRSRITTILTEVI